MTMTKLFKNEPLILYIQIQMTSYTRFPCRKHLVSFEEMQPEKKKNNVIMYLINLKS